VRDEVEIKEIEEEENMQAEFQQISEIEAECPTSGELSDQEIVALVQNEQKEDEESEVVDREEPEEAKYPLNKVSMQCIPLENFFNKIMTILKISHLLCVKHG
jgi:isopropylmalate/homocitrate/citramalate synthase